MTLTVCVGASGSGKTTFLEDVHRTHKCTYIRQYHMMRPYITVTKIPEFDPTQLPYWEIYEKEGKAKTIKVGGTLAGKFTEGLSGGQRKLMLFELIYQRTKEQKDLLVVLDEPFSGVTDDFVDFITDRLNRMRHQHNILLVTNDHVETLKNMADNVITVSAVDRSTVKLNDRDQVDREKAILALALGQKYQYESSHDALRFFLNVEVFHNGNLFQIAIFALFTFSLYIATFWNSAKSSAPLVLISGGIIAFFNINPYLLSLVEWRNSMLEEAEALVHSSAKLNRILKVTLTLSIIVILSVLEFWVVNLVIDGLFLEARYWVAMLSDSASLSLPLVCLGLYTRLPFQLVQIVGSLPFLLMIFFSTTFSPGAGLPVLKELRYIFPRFYFWCMVPGIQDAMEGCPAEGVNVMYMVLSAFTGVFVLFCILGALQLQKKLKKKKNEKERNELMKESRYLQEELYGERALKRFQSGQSVDDSAMESSSSSHDSSVSSAEDQV